MGMSTLNPYESSYIPLSERGKESEIKHLKTGSGDSDRVDKTTLTKLASESHVEARHNHLSGAGQVQYNYSGDWMPKGHRVPDLHFSQSQNANDVMQKLTLDEEAEMELDYLATMFPGMSDQSLADVYNASGGDMEASIEMPNQLESPAEFYHKLPDTLDIGNLAAEYGFPAEGTTALLKRTVSGEASGSSSQSPQNEIVVGY